MDEHNLWDILAHLKDHLLSGEGGDKIARIILFGSHAKGTAGPDSDIDILIATLDGREVEKVILDRAYDFMAAQQAPIEIVFSSVYDLFPPQDYFFYNVSRYGVEVYSMDAGEMKRVMVEGLARLAEEYLESAREVLERGRFRLAIDAGYNAAELAAKALILRKQDDVPGSHGGIVSLFGALYVKTGEVDAELGRRLNRALQLRNEARYRPGARLTKEDAEEVIRLAQALLALVTPCWGTPNISTEQP
ncbi:MAG: HEPN domain-containing protein [Anaerolineae bacterium]|nr:HEPN domain-containing protein [Anaerolineae bacterium]